MDAASPEYDLTVGFQQGASPSPEPLLLFFFFFFPPPASDAPTRDLHANTDGNFLDRPADGLKPAASISSGFKSVGSLPGSRGLSGVEGGGEISLDNMKVPPALLLVAVFLSQEWKSALSDSIIHIGELLRFFFPPAVRGHNEALVCGSSGAADRIDQPPDVQSAAPRVSWLPGAVRIAFI